MCVKGVLRDFKTEIVIELEKSLYLARTNFLTSNMYSICQRKDSSPSPNQGKSTLSRLAEVFSSYNSKVQFTVT